MVPEPEPGKRIVAIQDCPFLYCRIHSSTAFSRSVADGAPPVEPPHALCSFLPHARLHTRNAVPDAGSFVSLYTHTRTWHTPPTGAGDYEQYKDGFHDWLAT